MLPVFIGDETYRGEIVAAIEGLVAPYGIRVTTTRPPAALPYTMLVVEQSLSQVAGPFAGYDCLDLNQRGVAVYRVPEGHLADWTARYLLKGAGLTWGLLFSDDPRSLMCRAYFDQTCDSLSSQVWLDACGDVEGSDLCGQLDDGCAGGEQNDHAVMRYLFGDAEPDSTPPTAEIIAPKGDIEVPPGADVELRATVDDDFGGVGYRLTLTHDGVTLLDDPDFDRERVVDAYTVGLDLADLTEGTFVFAVEAVDHADHVAVDEVTITVTPDAGAGSDTGSGSSGGADEDTGTPPGTTGEPPDTTSSGPEPGAEDTGAEQDSDAQVEAPASCGCRSDGVAVGFGALPLLLFGRRRRL